MQVSSLAMSIMLKINKARDARVRSQQVFQLKMRNARVSLPRNEYYLKNINARDAQVSDLTIISAGLRPTLIYKTPP